MIVTWWWKHIWMAAAVCPSVLSDFSKLSTRKHFGNLTSLLNSNHMFSSAADENTLGALVSISGSRVTCVGVKVNNSEDHWCVVSRLWSSEAQRKKIHQAVTHVTCQKHHLCGCTGPPRWSRLKYLNYYWIKYQEILIRIWMKWHSLSSWCFLVAYPAAHMWFWETYGLLDGLWQSI